MPTGNHVKALSAALDAVDDLHNFIQLAHAGLDYAKEATEIDSLLRELGYRKESKSPDEGQIRENRLKKLQTFASSQASRGFPYLNSLGITRLTSILEVAVSDFIRDVLVSEADVRRSAIVLKLRGPIIEFAAASPGEQSDYLFEALSEQLGARLRSGSGRFESLLDAVGLGGPVDRAVRLALVELLETRNLYVHRSGKVDRRFREACPWTRIDVGLEFVVTNELYERCFAAVLWYLFELLRRETIKYPPPPDSDAAKLETILRGQEKWRALASRSPES